MERRIIFTDGAEELILPVTPKSFLIEDGIAVETVSITNVGDYIIPTHDTLSEFELESFFPAQPYPFARAAAEPYSYAAWFDFRARNKRVLRLIVDGTGINIAVIVTSIKYGEQDGTNDVYYTLHLRRYRYLGARTPAESEDILYTYTVQEGDTLSEIAQRVWGDPWLYVPLKKYNGLTDDFIYPGMALVIPSEALLRTIQ